MNSEVKIVSYDISNSQFKSELMSDYRKIEDALGIGVISDMEDEQLVKFESKIGTFWRKIANPERCCKQEKP